MDVSKTRGAPKSSILIGFSIINYKPSILGVIPLFLETPIWEIEELSEVGSYGTSRDDTLEAIFFLIDLYQTPEVRSLT